MPTTDATTGPEWKPARIWTVPRSGRSGSTGVRAAAARAATANRAMRAAWSRDWVGGGRVGRGGSKRAVVLRKIERIATNRGEYLIQLYQSAFMTISVMPICLRRIRMTKRHFLCANVAGIAGAHETTSVTPRCLCQ